MKIDILIGMLLLGMAVAAPVDMSKDDKSPEQSTIHPTQAPVASSDELNVISRAFPETPTSGQFNTYVLNPSDFGISLENLRALQALLGNQESPQSGDSILPSGLLSSTKTDKLNPTTIFQLYQPVITINNNYIMKPNAKIPNQPKEKPSHDKNIKLSNVESDGSMNESQNKHVTGNTAGSTLQATPSTESSSLPKEITTPTSLTSAVENAKVNLLNYLLYGNYKDSKAYPRPR